MLQTCKHLVQGISCNPYRTNPCLSSVVWRVGRCKNKITHCKWLRGLSGTVSVRNQPNLANKHSDNVASSDVQSERLSARPNQLSVADLKRPENSIQERLHDAPEKETELPTEYKSPDIGFWKSERGIVLKDQIFTGVGRVLRMFISKERSDNLYESAMVKEYYRWVC